MTSTLTIPDILTPAHREDAVAHLRRYFGTVSSTAGWAGSRFERLGGGGDLPRAVNRFTAEDLLAVTLLSVQVPPHGVLELLESRTDEFARLLAAIPTDLELVEAPELPGNWPPNALWSALQSIPGIGWVTAGKLMARKRPHLIPVYDRVVRAAVMPTGSFWEALRNALNADDRALYKHLESLRDEAGIGSDISILRVFDVVVWMHYRYLDDTTETP